FTYQRADGVAGDSALDIAFALEVEDQDGQLRFPAQANGGHIHHAQIISHDLSVSQLLVANRVRVQLWIFTVDAIDARGLEQDVRLQFTGTQGGCRISSHEWI